MKILTLRGFKNVRNLSGGYKTYLAATAPVINRTASVLEEDKTEGNTGNMDNIKIKTWKIDACGLQCPGPIMKVKTGDRFYRRRGTCGDSSDGCRFFARCAGLV